MEQAYGKAHTLHKEGHRTGAQCPRCGNPTVRVFDSQAEFHRACELRLMRDAGKIENLSYQVKYSLKVGENHLCFYVADFTYLEPDPKPDDPERQKFVVEDVKNKSMVVTEIALHKMKHFELQYGIEVNIVGR
jgi:hypothetical protein